MMTIIFDLGGVYFTDGTKEAVGKISAEYGIEEKLVSEVFRGEIGTEYREGVITHDEFWAKAKALWNRPEIPRDELARIWLNGYKPIDGTVEIIDGLKQEGYQLLFLSDNVQERVDYLEEKYGFLESFSGGVFSHIAKVRKPDPKIYKMALRLADGDCVYIDDKAELLVPAREMGMQTIHFTSAEALREGLEKLGIKVIEKEKTK